MLQRGRRARRVTAHRSQRHPGGAMSAANAHAFPVRWPLHRRDRVGQHRRAQRTAGGCLRRLGVCCARRRARGRVTTARDEARDGGGDRAGQSSGLRARCHDERASHRLPPSHPDAWRPGSRARLTPTKQACIREAADALLFCANMISDPSALAALALLFDQAAHRRTSCPAHGPRSCRHSATAPPTSTTAPPATSR